MWHVFILMGVPESSLHFSIDNQTYITILSTCQTLYPLFNLCQYFASIWSTFNSYFTSAENCLYYNHQLCHLQIVHFIFIALKPFLRINPWVQFYKELLVLTILAPKNQPPGIINLVMPIVPYITFDLFLVFVTVIVNLYSCIILPQM